MPSTLQDLLIQEDAADIYAAFLQICTTIGLPVTSWQAGDPTRALGQLEANFLEKMEAVAAGYIGSGFLDYASGMWLKICAKQNFNVDVPGATFASTSVTLTNSGGGFFTFGPGDLTFKNSSTGATYHNSTGGTLSGVGATLTVTVVADEAGSGSSAGATEIDTLVTTLLGVTCSNPTAAVGVNEQDPSVTIQQCRDKLGALSPNGPSAAYAYVARNTALTGLAYAPRVRVYPDSDTGDVLIYVASDRGAVSSPDVTAVQNAINLWATPLCITPTVASASNVTVAVTYSVWIYKSVNLDSSQIQSAIQTALETMFRTRPIGGDIIPPAVTGDLWFSLIESTIRNVYPDKIFRVQVTSPASDTALGNGDVAVIGAVTPTINLVTDPQ